MAELWLLPFLLCLLVLMVAATALAGYAVHRAIEAQIDVRALKASTHQVQFVPVDDIPAEDDRQLEKDVDADELKQWNALHQMASEPLS